MITQLDNTNTLDFKPRFARLWNACFLSLCHSAGIFYLPCPDLLLTLLHPGFGPLSLIWVDSLICPHFFLAFGWVQTEEPLQEIRRCFSLILSLPSDFSGSSHFSLVWAMVATPPLCYQLQFPAVSLSFPTPCKKFPYYIIFRLFNLTLSSLSYWTLTQPCCFFHFLNNILSFVVWLDSFNKAKYSKYVPDIPRYWEH